MERVIGGPAFRSFHSDNLLQMADLIAHALLKQEEEPSPRVKRLGIKRAFRILDRALNHRASKWDPHGVVRQGAGGHLLSNQVSGHAATEDARQWYIKKQGRLVLWPEEDHR